jgi:uncharacterized protein DUF4241
MKAQPVLSRTALLVLAVSVAAVVGVISIAYVRDHPRVDVSHHVDKTAAHDGVDLRASVSLRAESSGLIDIVAAVTIANLTDAPVLYAGISCYAPARVTLESTLSPPAGPVYPAAAATLREHVMNYGRSLDQIGHFTQTTRTIDGLDKCDESAPPTLPSKRTLAYSMTTTLGTATQPSIDPATTEVVTTLELGTLPAASGRIPPAIHTTSTISVRTSLKSLTDIRRASAARYQELSRDFDMLMRDASAGPWIAAQDPTLWRQARLMDPYPQSGEWKLTAFNHAWATPLIVAARGGSIVRITIPQEPWRSPSTTDAVIPVGATSAATSEFPYRDIYAGDLYLPEGKVMVGDPVSSEGMLTFDYSLRPGLYPVHVITAMPPYMGTDYESVAWMELLLSAAPVTHWRAAIPAGHSASELKPGDAFTFGTDGAGAGFASPEAMGFMDISLRTTSADIDDTLVGELGRREEANDWLWGLITVDPRTGANVFDTSTGSDGGFPVLVGLDAHDRPAVLLSDFNLLQMSYGDIHAIPPP